MVMEPMIARDIEKKHFFREISKEMGFTALKTGIAYLNKPYDNDYLNKNFVLSMISPAEGKERIYKAYMKKMIYEVEPNGTIIYKNFGITAVSPDSNHTDRLKEVLEAYDMPYIEIDPTNPASLGLNPFIIGNPALCGLIISLIIRGLYKPATFSAEMAYNEDVSRQAIQNLVILLKLMYPRKNEGLLPNLSDLLKCFTNFDYVQELCEELEQDEELAKEYELQLDYFKQNFYRGSDGRKDMHRFVHFASSTIDVLLRSAQIRSIVCNRSNNISFNDVINEGKIVLLSTRPYEIGGMQHRAFGSFFLMLMMCSVENNRELVKNRIPHFIYVDELDQYDVDSFGDMFLLYRKFKVGVIYSCQTIAGLGSTGQHILANSPTKISFGNSSPDEMSWWVQEFGKRKEWNVGYSYDKSEGEYSDKLGSPNWAWEDHMKLGKIQGLKFKNVIYKTKLKNGKNVVNFGKVDFLESKYKTAHKTKKYNFGKYIQSNDNEKNEKEKFNPSKVKFTRDERGDIDPIRMNTSDSTYFFDNEDAISISLNNKRKKKES